jgi:hypothetical protein
MIRHLATPAALAKAARDKGEGEQGRTPVAAAGPPRPKPARAAAESDCLQPARTTAPESRRAI